MGNDDTTRDSQRDPSDDADTTVTVTIQNRHAAHLDELCKSNGITRDEAIQQAIKSYIREHTRRARLSAYGLWKKRDRSGVDVQTTLRAKW